jgi:hypothetical protein
VRALVCLAVAVGFGGCSTLSAAPSSPPAQPVHQTALALPTATDTIEAFTTGYINWTAATVKVRMRALAKLSIGQARSAVLLLAAQTAQDYELARAGIANSGTVEAVAPLPGSSDEYVVVTRERTTASNSSAYQGLAPAWHLALAGVSRLAQGGWAVSSWQPEN